MMTSLKLLNDRVRISLTVLFMNSLQPHVGTRTSNLGTVALLVCEYAFDCSRCGRLGSVCYVLRIVVSTNVQMSIVVVSVVQDYW